jgi:excisionase family DNA binding protein
MSASFLPYSCGSAAASNESFDRSDVNVTIQKYSSRRGKRAATTSNEAPRLIAAKSAAQALGLPYTSLRDLAFRGELQVVKVGRAWYFERRDLEQWVSCRKAAVR